MTMKQPTDAELMVDSRQIGLGGLNTITDPQDMADSLSPSLLNVVLDAGVPTPRKGTSTYAEKPSGETLDALQCLVAKNSLGVEYMLSVYGNNFYVWDTTNEEFIPLTKTWEPTETTLKYGYTNWNNGLGDDSLYFNNGVDSVGKWPVVLQHLSVTTAAANTTITVDDGVYFPASGDIIIYDGVTATQKTYTSKAGNVLTLSGTVGAIIASGASVTMPIAEKSGMEKGRILNTFERRLVVMNAYQNEVKFAYSVLNDPEDFTTGSTPDAGGILQINDGNGPITSGGDFGEFFLIAKENNFIRFSIKLDDAGTAKFEEVKSLISGKYIGPASDGSAIKVSNSVYYITSENDLNIITPTQTGQTSTSGFKEISLPINNFVKTLSFDESKAAYIDQKVMWTFGEGDVNTSVLVYDLVRGAWLVWYGWNAQDLFTVGNTLYYMNRVNGTIYEALTGYDDAESAYTASLLTKRYSYGKAGMPKTIDKCYVEGYIKRTSNLFVTAYFNERGRLAERTYKIEGDAGYVSDIVGGAYGQNPWSTQALGLSEGENVGFFRVYLSLPNKYAFFNVQFEVYSESSGSLWGLSGISMNPMLEPIAPANMTLDPIN